MLMWLSGKIWQCRQVWAAPLDFVSLQSVALLHRASWSENVMQESKVLKQFTKTSPLLTLQTTDTVVQILLCRLKGIYVSFIFCSLSALCKRLWCQATNSCLLTWCCGVLCTSNYMLSTFNFYRHLWEFQVVRNVGAQTPPKSSLEDNIWSLSFSPSKAACVFEGHMPAKATASVPGTWPGRQSSFTIYLPLTQISITMEETPFLGKGLSKPAVCLVDHGRSFCFSWRCGFLRPVLPSVALNYARWRRTVWFPSSSSHPLNICFSTCLW